VQGIGNISILSANHSNSPP